MLIAHMKNLLQIYLDKKKKREIDKYGYCITWRNAMFIMSK